jgi:hypothetical protein
MNILHKLKKNSSKRNPLVICPVVVVLLFYLPCGGGAPLLRLDRDVPLHRHGTQCTGFAALIGLHFGAIGVEIADGNTSTFIPVCLANLWRALFVPFSLWRVL